MALTDQEVKHVARLARLAMTDADIPKYREQLGRILEFVKALERYDVKDVPPTLHGADAKTFLRDDVPAPFDNIEAILANAPDREDVYFKVKKVIE
jgi:aspartyl-tRNA(Asn)/glutamyl-tRNA(Gln) amidotransferase subunit C